MKEKQGKTEPLPLAAQAKFESHRVAILKNRGKIGWFEKTGLHLLDAFFHLHATEW